MLESSALCVRWGLLGALLAALSGCGTVDGASNRVVGLVTPYKIDIVQGNFVSREQLAALKEGMGRTQVRDILGTPLLTDIFHADRWDYVFTFKRQGVAPQSRRVTVRFKGDVLDKIEADEVPSEAEFVASLDSGRKAAQVPVLEMSEESLKASAAAPDQAAPAPTAPAPLPAKNYPPLEALAP